LLSLLVILGLVGLSAGIWLSNGRIQARVAAAAQDRRAFYLAESAIAEAMTAMRSDLPGNVGTMAAPAYLDGGVLWVTATDLGADRTRLVATALSGSGRAALDVVIEDLGQAPLFPSVLNSREQLSLNSGVMIDSYDSQLGSYASQAENVSGPHTYANQNGKVTSNQNIALSANATVFGDATPGPGMTVTMSMGSVVTGSTTPGAEPFAFPMIPPPAVGIGGALTLTPNSSSTLPAGTHGFSSMSIGKSATLTVQGPAKIVVDGNFLGDKDARLVIDATAGPVTVFVRGTYTHINGFQAVPAAGSPMALAWLIESSAPITFPASSQVRGAYYAPNADITFTSSNEAWGAFAGNRVSMSADMKFHYDESLAEYWNANTGAGQDPLQVRAWQVAEVTPAFLKTDRRGPAQTLGVDLRLLQSPANSWLP
jgi:hypothetical protein